MQSLTISQESLSKKRAGASVNAYLILRDRDRVLLSLRQNTGYCDGLYGLVSGHVEEGEPATAAMVREAKKEANLLISPLDLKPVHIMHRKTNRFNIDIFFECDSWQGALANLEPEKCAQLDFYSITGLPGDLVPYIQKALQEVYVQRRFYSEEGW